MKSRLKPRGALFLMNVIVDNDADTGAGAMVRAMRKQWRGVRLLDVTGWVDRNAVIAAGAVTKLKKPKVLMKPKTGAASLKRALALMRFSPLRKKTARRC